MLAAILGGCSATHQASQTPDDVYYSPARTHTVGDDQTTNDEYADAGNSKVSPGDDRYETAQSASDDHYLRMKVQDPDRWSSIDDYDYWYDSRYLYNGYAANPYYGGLGYDYAYSGLGWGYGSGFGLGFGGFYPGFGLGLGFGYGGGWYAPGYYWNSWNSPYYSVVYYKNPVAYSKPSGSNLQGFSNRRILNSNTGARYSNYNSSIHNNYNSFGSLVRRVVTNPNNNNAGNNNNNTWSRPVRTFSNTQSTPSSSAGGRSGGFSSSGGGAVSRPSRR